MIITSGIESTPNFVISKIVRLKNTFHLFGLLNTRDINRQYFPNWDMAVVISIGLPYSDYFNDKISAKLIIFSFSYLFRAFPMWQNKRF